MKKLMIVMAVIALAGASQAANFKWSTYAGQYVYKAGTTTKASGSVYLFDSSQVAQASLIAAVLGGTSISAAGAIDSTSLSSAGAISAKEFSYSTTADSVTTYFAIVDGDNIFISTEASGAASDVGTASLSFKALNTPSKAAAIEFSGASSYTGAGWYKSASTPVAPEPTSGLLMLVGLGALALRRRRA